MREVIDTYKKLQTEEFRDSQFYQDHERGNILFIKPQLSGKHFYKMILPYIVFHESDVFNTAMTGLSPYKNGEEIEYQDMPLRSQEIMWADVVVIPFTTQPLANIAGDDYSLYDQIRSMNPSIKIYFHVDYNYYKLSKYHPYHKKFQSDEVVRAVEDNIFFSDVVLVTNPKYMDFLHKKFQDLKANGRYQNRRTSVEIACQPLLGEADIIFESLSEDTPSAPEKTEEETAPKQEEKKEKKKSIPKPPKGVTPPTIKEVKEYFEGKGYELAEVAAQAFISIHDELGWVLGKGKNKKPIKAWKKLSMTFYSSFEKQQKEEAAKPPQPSPIRVGIIASYFYHEDITAFHSQLKRAKEAHGDDLTFVVMGYDGKSDKFNNDALEGIDFEYVKPCSINHYFKNLFALNLDAIFVPLRNNEFNQTSENYNKFIESGLLGIPLIAPNVFPYSDIITNRIDGFVLDKKDDLIELLGELIAKPNLLEDVSGRANELVNNNFSYHPDSLEVMAQIYSDAPISDAD